MTLPVRISEEAEAEMAEAARWYETHRAGLGTEFLDAVDTAVSKIGRSSHGIASTERLGSEHPSATSAPLSVPRRLRGAFGSTPDSCDGP